MKLTELADKTGSIIDTGDPGLDIHSTAGLDIAGEGEITFLANPKYTPQIRDTRASAIFLNEGIEIGRGDIAVLRSKDSYLAYTRAMRLFFPEPVITPFVHPTAVIDGTANVADNVEIHDRAMIDVWCEMTSS